MNLALICFEPKKHSLLFSFNTEMLYMLHLLVIFINFDHIYQSLRCSAKTVENENENHFIGNMYVINAANGKDTIHTLSMSTFEWPNLSLSLASMLLRNKHSHASARF